jgi:DNA primase
VNGLNYAQTEYIPDSRREEVLAKYELIRQSVSAIDVGVALGLEINSKGRCRCPFHNGHDNNMRLYPEDRGFYCFVCHESGDCIKLAQKMMEDTAGKCTYRDAAGWIDDTFHLSVFFTDGKPSIRERARRIRTRKTCAGGNKA